MRRGYAIHWTVALALSLPAAMLAQLPDAPSAVRARRQQALAQAEQKAPLPRVPHFQAASGQLVWNDTAEISMVRAAPAEGPPEEGSGQQSLYRPARPRVVSGYSTSIADVRPVPGAAPILQNSCPSHTCSLAQTYMCCGTAPSPFAQYLKSPDVVPLTARDNLHSALKNLIDPFNLLTIAGDSAVGVATDSHSVYGPGMEGFSKYAGVSITEDMTGEFFGTFLVPSLIHQDVHYHREPFMPIKHRILHAIVQVVWSQSTTGTPMPNYANLVGGIATAVVSNTFVPGPGRQGFSATAQRLAIAFATSPSGNLIEEFVPDIASRINLRVVIFQRILNTVSIEEAGGQ